MLPILLVLSIIAIALAGAGVVWLLVAQILPPLVATLGALGVIAACVVALALLTARGRVRRLQRELRTVRRSEAIREREPVRFPRTEEDEDGLVHALAPGLAPDDGAKAEARPDADALDAAVIRAVETRALQVFLEPVVVMPANETIAYRARCGLPATLAPEGVDASRPIALDALGREARGLAELGLARAARPLAEGPLEGLPVHCEASEALLGERERMRALVRVIEESDAPLGFRVATPTLDALAGGRLDDLVDAGATLIETAYRPGAIERSEAAELARRGIGHCAFDAREAAADPAAATAVRRLGEAGIVPLAENLSDENALIDCADLGIARFSGPLFGEPRRVREGVADPDTDADTARDPDREAGAEDDMRRSGPTQAGDPARVDEGRGTIGADDGTGAGAAEGETGLAPADAETGPAAADGAAGTRDEGDGRAT